MSAMLDTLPLSTRLRDAGVQAHQAEAASRGLAEVLATRFDNLVRREDLEHATSLLRAEMQPLAAQEEMSKLRAEMQLLATKDEVNQLRVDMVAGFAELRGQIRLLQWMFGTLVAGIGALLAVAAALLLRGVV